MKVGSVELNPFELMQGDIISDTSALISKMTKSEKVKVGEEWIANTDKKWYKPWTWFQEKGHYKEIYEDKEYVDGTELAQKFLLRFRNYCMKTVKVPLSMQRNRQR